MHQLGLTAADVTTFLQKEGDPGARIAESRERFLQAGHSAEQAQALSLVQYLQDFSARLLELNNHKIATDLVRLGVLTGTILRDGEASF